MTLSMKPRSIALLIAASHALIGLAVVTVFSLYIFPEVSADGILQTRMVLLSTTLIIISTLVAWFVAWFCFRRLESEGRAKVISKQALFAMENKALAGMFAGTLAHDSNNLLGTLRIGLGILEKQWDDPEKRAECLQRMEDAIELMAQINRRIMLHSHSVKAQASPPLLVRPLLEETVAMVQNNPRWGERTIDLEGGDGIVFQGDQIFLRQAILNLVWNAVDATGPDGRIVVKTNSDDGEIQIAVHDNGHGVPPELREKIFQPFFTTKSEGTGLGLQSVRGIMDIIGGSVTLTDSPMGGACFQITFPARPPIEDKHTKGTKHASMRERIAAR